jgi:hypothetical protein
MRRALWLGAASVVAGVALLVAPAASETEPAVPPVGSNPSTYPTRPGYHLCDPEVSGGYWLPDGVPCKTPVTEAPAPTKYCLGYSQPFPVDQPCPRPPDDNCHASAAPPPECGDTTKPPPVPTSPPPPPVITAINGPVYPGGPGAVPTTAPPTSPPPTNPPPTNPPPTQQGRVGQLPPTE